MTNRILIILTALLLTATICQAQYTDSTSLWDGEKKVSKLFEKCMGASEDPQKIAYASEIANEMEYLLNTPLAFGYDFPYLKNISSVRSQDGKVRVITYCAPLRNGKFVYHGFVMYDGEDDVTVTRLKQGRRPVSDPMDANMQSDNWFGAIYYEISQWKCGRDCPTIYALCGWDGADMFTNRKVLEQMNFDEDNKPIFGGLFQTENGNGYSRIVFTFGERVAMSMQYDRSEKMIIADHLSPSPSCNCEGQYQFYGPDMSYDGFYYKDGKWHWEFDVNVKIRN